ncbi:MAG: hypothetical protein FJX54_06055 [Alphaproteobacteria bacterium]|nr:hypothetical protein [Alphaproteobacteria bacterium]
MTWSSRLSRWLAGVFGILAFCALMIGGMQLIPIGAPHGLPGAISFIGLVWFFVAANITLLVAIAHQARPKEHRRTLRWILYFGIANCVYSVLLYSAEIVGDLTYLSIVTAPLSLFG